MYIAMNRFKIAPGREEDFENNWKNRDSHLEGVPGFQEFKLLRGKTTDEYTLFASHSTWNSQSEFSDWTQSENFRKAHGSAGGSRDMYLGHPEFEGFEAVL